MWPTGGENPDTLNAVKALVTTHGTFRNRDSPAKRHGPGSDPNQIAAQHGTEATFPSPWGFCIPLPSCCEAINSSASHSPAINMECVSPVTQTTAWVLQWNGKRRQAEVNLRRPRRGLTNYNTRIISPRLHYLPWHRFHDWKGEVYGVGDVGLVGNWG
jgi:hypothetical protein